ncbi:DNA-3-methyladenine glycosylase 2 family protein [Ketobacter sp. MCCC 1A13808]|nr:DNA-3-methyladenine glycosylase 2 family protein [Ketobacter sp. MCCC 1A13808]RLP55487.1 MAG: DNA-3-methyladenine glycosylase 2 family protein [Ketobacter sp.]
MAELAKADPDVGKGVGLVGIPEPRVRPAGFSTLFHTILSQQISTSASAAILGRVMLLMPELTPERVLQTDVEQLRTAGMSYRKIEYAKGLALAITDGSLDVDRLAELDDHEAIQQIVQLKGFGRWSAEIYLMFSLGRRDIFPADDLALQVALMKLKSLPQRPTPKQTRVLTEIWSPWRSVGAIFLWHYYRGAPN